jgi:hypothetical protein
MQSPKPWTLSVHVRALDRALERRRYRPRHRRFYGVNRGSEATGKVPDYDQRDHEAEVAEIVADLTHSATGNLYDVAVYQTIREPGPDPDPEALAEPVEHAVGAIQHAADVGIGRGEFRQLDLWRSSLPLGLDVAKARRRYATVNAADTLPLVDTSCGSPSGLHLGYADPGRTLERLDPFDPLHDNGTLIVNGKVRRRQDVPRAGAALPGAAARRPCDRDRPLRRPLPACVLPTTPLSRINRRYGRHQTEPSHSIFMPRKGAARRNTPNWRSASLVRQRAAKRGSDQRLLS